MKKKVHLGKLEKLVILVMVITLAVSILPQLDLQQLFAEDPAAVTLELKEGNVTRPLSASTTDAKAVEAVLLKDGVEIERKIMNTTTPAQFDIIQNGTYVIQSIDVQGTVLEEHEQVVEGLVDLYVEKVSSLVITSRIADTDHIAVTFQEKKEPVKVEKQPNGLYQSTYTPKENGSYVFQSEAADGTALGKAVTYEETGITEQKPEDPKKEEPQEEKEIHITTEQGLKDIGKATDKTYILDADITVTSDSIMVEKEFTGTLEGNGHVIKGLKQPLFSSLNKATIRNISISSEINNNHDTAALAVDAKDTKISGIGILATITSQRSASGMLVSATNTSIENSYVSGKITGEASASGFVVSGSAAITNSYVTGIIEGKQSAYGFGKDTDITNSYAAVYVDGKEAGDFNSSDSRLENSFYDISVAAIEESRAQEYTSAQMVSGSISLIDFQQNKGSYPSLKKEITEKYSEEAKKLSALSTLAVSTDTSLMGLTKDVTLPGSTGAEDIAWSAEGNVGVSGNAAIAKVTRSLEQDTEGTLVAKTTSGTRILKAASAKLMMTDEPQAGQSVAEKTTSISFNMEANHYYLITKDGDMESKLPADHKTAIEGGWRRYLWDGAISWDGLEWNTAYYVYDYDLKGTGTVDIKTIKTSKGKIGGSIQLSEDMAVGKTLYATLENALTTNGTWKWEKAESPTSKEWTPLEGDVNAESNTESSYVLKEDDSGKYIRATFTAEDASFTGSVTASSKTVVKAPLSSVRIYTNAERTDAATDDNMIVDTRLYAKVEPNNFDTEVEYTWHYVNEDESIDETVQGRGTSYLLQGKEVVDKKICVKATAKGEGGASGTVTSAIFANSVAAAPTDAPTVAPVLAVDEKTSIEDKSITVKMPEDYTNGEGLYQFAFARSGEEKTEFNIYARGSNPVTITGLKPKTQYFIFVRAIGENGHLTSSYYEEKPLSVYTKNPYVEGTLDISASGTGYRYGETLTAKLTGNPFSQTGTYCWYLVNDDGTRGEAVSESDAEGHEFKLVWNADNVEKFVGHRLEVVYSGTGNYGGEISAQSEILQLAEQSAPKVFLTQNGDPTDSEVRVILPSLSGGLVNEKFNIGFSKLKNGVPEEYRPEGKGIICTPGQNVTISGLDRNTDYYFFLRFVGNEKHEKSDWSSSDNILNLKTKQTTFNGAIFLQYGKDVKSNPVQGDRLTARLGMATDPGNIPNTTEGTWVWYKTKPGGEREAIKNFYPGTDGYSTYYEIPETEEEGTIYEVEFIFHEDFTITKDSGATGTQVEATSGALQKLKREKMTQPDGDKIIGAKDAATDSTITFQMDGEQGLVYSFQYSKDTNESSGIPADYDAYAGTNVTIKDLDRDTEYHIWVKVKGQDQKIDSDWSTKYMTVKTEKTSILGYVEIEGTDTAGQELKASYRKATYIPEGDDTKGKWQWYRENDAHDYDRITGATNATYTPGDEDIKRKLKAVYTMEETDHFKESKEALTAEIKKSLITNPEIVSFVQGDDTGDSRPTLNFSVKENTNVWYRIQRRVDPAPEIPKQIESQDLEKAGWKSCTNTEMTGIDKDHTGANLTANTDYYLYVVRPETGLTQVSSIMNEMTNIGAVTQKGTVEISYLDGDEVIQYPVIGKTVKATLTGGNNTKGTWKWYRSTVDCGESGTASIPDVKDETKWEQLPGGYSPTINSAESNLTVSEDLWKYYLKAEFVPNSAEGYGGDSIKAADGKYVRKIYNETVSIDSSSKNGNKEPAAYPGSKITAKVENLSGEALSGRLIAYINETNPVQLSGFTIKDDTLTVTLGELENQDTQDVFVELVPPSNHMLYVDITLNELASKKKNSVGIPYKNGISINNVEDLKSFMLATGAFADRGAKYVITNDIDMSSIGIVSVSTTPFSGTLDGDYHTLINANVYLIYTIKGTASSYATLKNMVIFNANIDSTKLPGGSGMSHAGVLGYQSTYANIENILIANSKLRAGWNVGFFLAYSSETNFRRCGSVGGEGISGGGAVGGFVADAGTLPNAKFNDVFSISTVFKADPGKTGYSYGGIVGWTAEDWSNKGSKYPADQFISNSYVASVIPTSNQTGYGSGMILGQNPGKGSVIENVYYDNRYSQTGSGNSYSSNWGTGLSTEAMLGDKLKNGLDENWSFSEGNYPMLNWMKDLGSAKLFSTTLGAFKSLDNATPSTDLFKGDISGAIMMAPELTGNEFSYSSSDENVLKVTEGGTIIPLSIGTAKIIVRYDNPSGGYAENSLFEFNVKKTVKALNSVSVDGITTPGKTLTATASGATGITYKWYRRKTGTTNRELITEANSKTYTIKPSDIGYEINVDVGASGYATMSSGYTKAITSVQPTGIIKKSAADNSLTVQAEGIEGADYEYAYATSSAGNKIIAGHSTNDFTITGLARNKIYWIYARVAGGTGYEASDWSKAVELTTEKTKVVGPVKTNGEINMGKEIRISIGDDNLQTGTWKVMRGSDDITGSVKQESAYVISYTLQEVDVGKELTFSFEGTGDYKNPDTGAESLTTDPILRKTQTAPAAPIGVMKDAHTITIHHTGDGRYDFGYTKTAGNDIKPLDNGGEGYINHEEVDIPDLERNTTYYLYARLHEQTDYEPSDWSPFIAVTTDRSNITGSENSSITITGDPTVENTLIFTASGKTEDTAGMSGIWVLERVNGDKANTLLGDIDTTDQNKIRYTLQPEDAGYTIRATYNATGDYQGTTSITSSEISNAGQTVGTVTASIANVEEYSAKLTVDKTNEEAAIYEFGYKKSAESEADIKTNNVTVTWGKPVDITQLSRNTGYDFYIRKAKKIGYNVSSWEQINTKPIETKRSPLLGNISIVGDNQKPGVDKTITVSYDQGIYPDNGDDTESGSWQWYLGETAVSKDKGGTSPSFTIPPVENNPKVKVRFTALENSDFTSYVERSFGNVYKEEYEIPKEPIVTAEGEDNQKIGSLLKLTNQETAPEAMYYYLQEAGIDDLPELDTAEHVDEMENHAVNNDSTDNVGHWIKVTDQEMMIRVKANTKYVTYVARLESKSHAASGINSTRSVKSAKEPLARTDYNQIEEADSKVEWKTLQSKTLKYTVDDKAPTVSWKYYVADSKDATNWQNIDAEMRAVKDTREDGISEDGKYAVSRFQVPLKYTGQYLKITMTGIDDYSGVITYITEKPLQGAMITGTASINASDTTKVLDVLEAKYDGTDEMNGIFTWYRQSVDPSNKPNGIVEKITDTDPGSTSTYDLKPADLDHRVFAVYTAPVSGQYVGTVETNYFVVRKKAVQNTPVAPKKVRVNGNSIQFSTPTNYKTDKTVDIPYVQVGYLRYMENQPVDDEGNSLTTQEAIEANIHWQSDTEYKAQETWFYGLKKESDYKLFARFMPTAAYDQSAVSPPSEIITTEHALFDEDNLKIQDVVNIRQADARPSNIGSQIRITYIGDGYDEGEFLLHRSNGEDIVLDSSSMTIDPAMKTNSYTYTYAKEDVGSYITAEFKAKADAAHYQGSIKKTNSIIVTKETNPGQPEAKYQILKRNLDTNLILTSVNDKYEYYLSKEEAYVPEEGDWDTLKTKDDGSHEFTNLNRTKKYYLWTRIAETDTYDPSKSVKSEGLSPEPFINFGPLMITNSKDRKSPPKTESDYIAFPDTLKKGTLSIKENQITKDVEESTPEEEKITANIKHPVSDFMKSDGSATDLIYEKGSTWGDRNFAVELVFYDKGYTVLARADGTKTSIDVPDTTAFMKVFLYRVNAMSETDYTWEAMLEDGSEERITAKLKADITMDTQISMELPTKIQLTLDEQVMRQSTNNEQAINKSSMPMEFGIDRRVAVKSDKVPSLKGEMNSTTYYDQIPNDEAYLKCSNDGTNFTNITNGAWMDTGLPSSDPAYLMRLGADAWSGYYFSGITSKQQIWNFTENKFIDEAYKFKFLIEVSKEDAAISGKSIYEVKSEEGTK